jgi:hypothetical protein
MTVELQLRLITEIRFAVVELAARFVRARSDGCYPNQASYPHLTVSTVVLG